MLFEDCARRLLAIDDINYLPKDPNGALKPLAKWRGAQKASALTQVTEHLIQHLRDRAEQVKPKSGPSTEGYISPPPSGVPGQGVPPEVAEWLRNLWVQAHQPQGRSDPPEPFRRIVGEPDLKAINLGTVSRFLALVLRYEPSAAAINLDGEGWADVDALIKGVNATGYPLAFDDLNAIVRTSLGHRNEPRFAFSPDKQRIRANWGRSIQKRSDSHS